MSLPWFPCYPNDLLGSLRWQMMTPEERGAYWQLLCLCYQSAIGKIMAPLHLLSRMSGIDLTEHPLVLDAFKQDENGAWYNERAYHEWLKRADVSEKRSDAGAKGAANRWQKHKQIDGKCMANATTSTSTSTYQSHINNQEEKHSARTQAPAKRSPLDPSPKPHRWEDVEAIYPVDRLTPDDGARKWCIKNLKKNDALWDEFLARMRKWCETRRFQDGYAPNIYKYCTSGYCRKDPPEDMNTPWAGAVNG